MPPSPHLLLSDDHGLWAVDKPAGWVSHAARPDEPYDVLRWARDEGLPDGLAPIHRLDRGTSGVLLLAADPEVRREVGEWLAAGRVQKVYLALVHGRTRTKGIIRRPLPDARRGRPVDAVTRYSVLERFPTTTLLRVRPEHGRKHQIRRHLQGIGHPVVGDERFGPRRFRSVKGFPGRMWLHAAEVRLPDGRTVCSELPEALEEHLRVLRG